MMMCTSRPAGTLHSTSSRNLRNSWARWRGMHWPITVPAFHRGDEAREQRRGAVALVIVRAPLDLPRTHRQQRLRAIEGLDLALLILSLSKDHRRRSPAPCRADRDRARRYRA